jgi:hypothetical protein
MDHLTAERPALRALVRGAALTAVTTTCIAEQDAAAKDGASLPKTTNQFV